METRNALRFALSMSGKYDTGRKLAVRGRDMYGHETAEEIPETDTVRMEADIDAILRGDLPSPIRSAEGIGVVDVMLPNK